MKDILKKHEEKLNYVKVGKMLLKDEYNKTNQKLKGKPLTFSSEMKSFDKKFEYSSIIKAFEENFHIKKKRNMSGINNKSVFKTNKLLLTRVKPTKSSYKRNVSAIISNSKIRNNNNKTGKTLSQDSFLSFFYRTFQKKEFPSLINSLKNKDIKKDNRKLILLPYNKEQVNFSRSINLRMKYLKNNEKLNKLKRYLSITAYKEISNTNKEINDERKFFDSQDNKEEDNIEIDPFQDMKNNNFEYGKIMKNLKQQYNFYPYNYLEDHKYIEPHKFKFMVDNFNSKFSLFGKNINISEDDIPSLKKSKKIYRNIIYKPSIKYMKKLKKSKSKK